MYPRIPRIPAHHRFFTHFGEDYLLLHVLLTIRLGGAGEKKRSHLDGRIQGSVQHTQQETRTSKWTDWFIPPLGTSKFPRE